MTNDAERQLREQYEIKQGDTPEVIEEKIDKYYHRYTRVSYSGYKNALILVRDMFNSSIKAKNTKLALQYAKVWYKLNSLCNKKKRKHIMDDRPLDNGISDEEFIDEFNALVEKYNSKFEINLSFNSISELLRRIKFGKKTVLCRIESIVYAKMNKVDDKKDKHSRK